MKEITFDFSNIHSTIAQQDIDYKINRCFIKKAAAFLKKFSKNATAIFDNVSEDNYVDKFTAKMEF